MSENINFVKEADDLFVEACQVRRTLHRHPEIGNHEFFTSAFIKDYLQKLGLEVIPVLDTGVIGVLQGEKPGKTVGLRADIDALPILEQTGCEFASENEGFMHACGHDMHMTAALLTAKLLACHKEDIQGKILFIFQPDEEGFGGARRIIATGVLEGCSAVFGAHVDPTLPKDTVGFKYGKFYAAADNFDVKVIGESCHGATPEKGHNALVCSCEMVEKLDKLPGEFTDQTVLTTGIINSGKAVNVIAGESQFAGLIRTLGPDNRARMKQRFVEVCNEVAAKYGCQAEVLLRESYMGIINKDEDTSFALQKAKELFKEEEIVVFDKARMITEDFGYYVEAYGGSFYHVSANCSFPLHHDHFLPEEGVLKKMVALHSKVLYDYLVEG